MASRRTLPPRRDGAIPDQATLPELAGTRTHENLRAAYAEDAQVAGLCASFARIAEIEGHPEVARTLRDLAESQALVAAGHLDLLRRAGDPLTDLPIGETLLNVRSLLEAARRQVGEALPEGARTAHAEGFADVASWFETLAHARRAHLDRVREALARVEDGPA